MKPVSFIPIILPQISATTKRLRTDANYNIGDSEI